MRKAIVRLKKAIIHPFAFSVSPVISLYVKNMGRGHLREAIEITIGVLISAVLLWLLADLFVKNKRKSAVIISVFFVLFFSYGHVISALGTLLERMHLLDKARFLVQGNPALLSWLAVWTLLFVAASLFASRLTSDLSLVTGFLNVVGLTFVIMIGVNFFAAGGFNTFLIPHVRTYVDQVHAHVIRLSETDTDATNADEFLGETSVTGADGFRVFLPLVANSEPVDRASDFVDLWQEREDIPSEDVDATLGYLPDIYYIILDMYARGDYLERMYDYDNSEFLSFLTDRGFYVADESRANYPYSSHSLASSLNLMYLDEVADKVGDECPSFGPSIAMLNDSMLARYLHDHGYTTVAFATGYWFTEIKDADVYMEPTVPMWYPSEFQSALIHVTPLTILPTFRTTEDDLHRQRVLYTFEHIADATKIDSPVFVFAHIVAPHPPYAFGPNGEPVQSKPHGSYTYDEFREAYRNQVTHVNKRMMVVIEEILSQSSEPPIIIMQADHGACKGRYLPNISARMSILNAYYFPDQNYETLYEDITPVNTFRVVLNNYFGTDYRLLEDRSYHSTTDRPYLFTDVTEEVLAGENADDHR